MIGSILKKIFGTKNEREVKRIRKIVEKINALEPTIEKLSDAELKGKTLEFKTRLQNGETLNDILVEAFAVVREASKRVHGMRHYDVQLIGGIVLHEGKITEMKTGEGKTLVATGPVYLNALTGKGVHVITVNDYLAQRDREIMSKVYDYLGLTSGVILSGMDNQLRKEAYQADITYGTNSEFGFDYLRDNMVNHIEERVQRKLNFCIVDEVDSILIDEARTPLIISGAAEDTAKWHNIFAQIAFQLDRSYETEKIKDPKQKKLMNIPDEKWGDYEVDEKSRNVVLTDKGIKRVEKMLNIDNMYSPEHVELTHYLNQALKAKELFIKDRDYLLRDGEVIIIDEFTGRAMEGRRYSDGLHQAIEAKEGVNVAGENQTLATITLQNYFRMYEKLAGMTGTAETESAEFVLTYNLQVVVIPTNRPVQRKDYDDEIYATKREKFGAIVKKIKELYEKGQPVLVGTASISSSEEVSELLKKEKIPHSVLNAKFHAKEAEIIAQAGRYKAVTIATNMAGRGTDIMLGGNPEFMAYDEVQDTESPDYIEAVTKYKKQCEEEKKKVLDLGGLFILGTERHESRRIDNQLRGRAGRQGDPGASVFYLSLEDDLMRLFGNDRMRNMVGKGLAEGEALTSKWLSKGVANAQKQVESRNFGIRKNLLEYDDVMNKQREAIYSSRNAALEQDDLKESIMSMLKGSVSDIIYSKFQGEHKEDWDIQGVADELKERYGYELENLEEYKSMSIEEYIEAVYNKLESEYTKKEKEIGIEHMRKIEKYVLFEVVDSRWREHLKNLDRLKEGIYLRAYGQKDPLVEYKLVSGDLYSKMLAGMRDEISSYMFKVVIKDPEEEIVEIGEEMDPDELCRCGSGKPYGKCCGRL